ncbi:hypothetical protein [Roseimicrobium gellanilyticum]|nr:hypothetical protein [Roseimicrobium gellanilyticum]
MNTSDYSLNFLDQTATLRLNPKWEDVRQLLDTRGVAAGQAILFSCDHAGGLDMSVWFALPDGSIIDAVMRKDSASSRYVSIVQWRKDEATDDEMLLARRITTNSELAAAFAKAVESYYAFQSCCGKHCASFVQGA